jgi:hypothetical protein
MDEQQFEGNYGRVVLLDLCPGCHGLWFDTNESLNLTPGAILRLFSTSAEKQNDQRQPLAEVMRCPRCGRRLTATTDQQRNTRFHYFRCPEEHGRFITFFQFLREKNFVRSLNSQEIGALRQHLKMVNCSNCGAAINLADDFACSYCKTPISMLDPTQLEATTRLLQQADAKRQLINASLPVERILERVKMDSAHRQHSNASTTVSGFLDLLAVGITSVADLLIDSH